MSNILTEHRKRKSGICEAFREGLEKGMRKKKSNDAGKLEKCEKVIEEWENQEIK